MFSKTGTRIVMVDVSLEFNFSENLLGHLKTDFSKILNIFLAIN